MRRHIRRTGLYVRKSRTDIEQKNEEKNMTHYADTETSCCDLQERMNMTL